MKKTLILMAVAFMTIGTVNVQAQKTCNTTKCDRQECTQKRQCRNQILYQNLNLTQDQKQQIQELDSLQALKIKAQKSQAREQKQLNDSIILADRASYLQNLKAMLTPYQYITYLENYYQYTAGKPGNKAPKDKAVKNGKLNNKHQGNKKHQRK